MIKIKIVTIKKELQSARSLGWPTTTNVAAETNDNPNTAYIRWGNSEYIYDGKTNDFLCVINPADSISLNCTKDQALLKISKVVCTPRLYLQEDLVPRNQKVIFRPTSHDSGKGFKVKTGPFMIEDGFYATEFIPSDLEFRVWFAGEKTLRVKRVPMSDSIISKYPCRSNWGYRFLGYQQVPKSLHNATLIAAKTIGLETGAADVIYSKGKFFFLELNSAPSIDHSKVRRFFQKEIPILIQSKFGK